MNLASPDVTVVIPTRNRLALLKECLASVRGQEAVRIQIIVVDDHSSDGTWEWLASVKEFSLTRIRQKSNQRQSAARNLGLAVADARNIMFLDDDDLLKPGALRILCAALDSRPQSVAAVGRREDWFTGEGYRRRDVHPPIPTCRGVLRDLIGGWSAVPSQTLFRTEVAKRVGGYDESVLPCDDRDFLQKAAMLGPVCFRPEVVVTYRITPEQWRPENIHDLREIVARRAIKSLPKKQRRRALATRRLVQLQDQADRQFAGGSIWKGIRYCGTALLVAPQAYLSPLLAAVFVRRLAGRLARRFLRPNKISVQP